MGWLARRALSTGYNRGGKDFLKWWICTISYSNGLADGSTCRCIAPWTTICHSLACTTYRPRWKADFARNCRSCSACSSTPSRRRTTGARSSRNAGGALFDGGILLIMRRSVTERVAIHLAGNFRQCAPADGNHLGHDGNRDLFGRDRSDLKTHRGVHILELVGGNPFFFQLLVDRDGLAA